MRNTGRDEFGRGLVRHILDLHRVRAASNLGPPILAHIDLNVLIDRRIQCLNHLVGRLVPGEHVRLPVIDLNLLSH